MVSSAANGRLQIDFSLGLKRNIFPGPLLRFPPQMGRQVELLSRGSMTLFDGHTFVYVHSCMHARILRLLHETGCFYCRARGRHGMYASTYRRNIVYLDTELEWVDPKYPSRAFCRAIHQPTRKCPLAHDSSQSPVVIPRRWSTPGWAGPIHRYGLCIRFNIYYPGRGVTMLRERHRSNITSYYAIHVQHRPLADHNGAP